MNVAHLETMVRNTLSGENITEKSAALAESGAICPAEHRSLQSMAARLDANSGPGSRTAGVSDAVGPQLMWF